jgi:hypothetical protein
MKKIEYNVGITVVYSDGTSINRFEITHGDAFITVCHDLKKAEIVANALHAMTGGRFIKD